jgi:two-component system, NarL family, sensor histidine kinase DesK
MTSETTTTRRPGWAWAAPVFGALWLAVPFAALLGSDPEPWQLSLAGPGLLAFAALFLSVVMTRRPLLPPLLGMVGIGVALTLAAHDSFALLFIYAASAAGVRLPARASAVAVTAITAVAAATLALTDPASGVFWGITAAVAANGTLWLLIAGLLRANAELGDARAELADMAVAEERLRFARDLHDLLGHDLSLIALKAELAGKLLPARAEEAASEVGDLKALARNALTQVRQAVDGYRRPTLPGELAGARVALEAAGIELTVDEHKGTVPLSSDEEAVLAFAVREGVTNVIRHSGAERATITVTRASVAIADDGPRAADPNGSGHGIAGLRERAEAVGGAVEAGADPDGGFRLVVSV